MHDDGLTNQLFDIVVQLLSDEDVRKSISIADKEVVLRALNFSVLDESDDRVKVSFLFFTLTVDTTDKDNPKFNVEMDMTKLVQAQMAKKS